jgi:hypothetical protein
VSILYDLALALGSLLLILVAVGAIAFLTERNWHSVD